MTPFPRLILVDGLPGSGKSTTAQQLWLQLETLGRPARWWFEHETGHPIFDDEQVRTARSMGRGEPNSIFERAHRAWGELAGRIAGGGETLILESTLFQTTLGTQLLMEASRAEMVAHFERTAAILAPLQPVLIELFQPDPAAALRRACARRPGWFEEFLGQQFAATPRGRRLGSCDFDALADYFEERQALAAELATRFPGARLRHDCSGGDWAAQRRAVAAFLGLPPAGPAAPPANAGDFTGRYRANTGDDLTIAADAAGLYLADEARARLWPHGPDAFVIEGLCVELGFARDAAGRVRAIDCRGALPGLATAWFRV